MAVIDDDPPVRSIVELPGCSPVEGVVRWDPATSIWNGAMLAIALVAVPLTFSWGAFSVFAALTGGTLLAGHSVGMHRRLIHHSFECPQWLEFALVYAGVLVGLAGPIGMIRTHDLRDWAQRQADCHPYLAHRESMLKDAWWQLHCRLVLDHPPAFDPGSTGERRAYRWLERSWRWQQVPLALLLLAAGGWAWVIWGVCLRVSVCVTGHWFVGHLAHRRGPQSWLVRDAGVQAHDVPWAAIPTMGEAWHNNHHAFPGSALIGVHPGQSDWGYAFILLLARLGLAWNIRTPSGMVARRRKLQPVLP